MMERITVSDIPLPGEPFDFKRQPENEAQKIVADFLEDVTDTDDCVTSEIITESVAELQMEVEQCVNTSMESADKTIDLEEQTNQVVDNTQTIEVIDDSEHTPQLEEQTNEVDTAMETSQIEEQTTETVEETLETPQTEEQTTEVIEETVETPQHEEQTTDVVEETLETPQVEEQTTETVEETLETPQIEEQTTETVEETLETPQIEEQTNESVEEIVETPQIEEQSSEVIEETETPQIEEQTNEVVEEIETPQIEIKITEVIDDTIEISESETNDKSVEETETTDTSIVTVEEPAESAEISKPEQPAKINKRSNSTIEAIKNDWITIEEINEEISETNSPNPEPIVIEPDKKDETEKVENSETVDEVPAIVVIETVQEHALPNMDNNITIEIIDNNTVNNATATVIETHDLAETIERAAIEIADIVEANPERVEQAEEQTVLIIEEEPVQEKVEEKVEEKVVANNNEPVRRRGRPSKGIQRSGDKLPIPCHVMGRNVDNPQEDLISNGRTPPKPRLGVKVPYRFLTSQIVSKEEIADELLELTSKRNPKPDPPAGGDIFFASKLTQRLATRIAHANKRKASEPPAATSGIPLDALNNTSTIPTTPTTTTSTPKTIRDNSDLLAILEGDVDVDWTKEVRNNKTDSDDTKHKLVTPPKPLTDIPALPAKKTLDPEMEREIALKQLAQLPKKNNRGRPRKYFTDQQPTLPKVVEQPPQPQPKPVVKKETVTTPTKPVKEPPKPIKEPPKSMDLKQAANKISQKIQESIKQDTSMDMETDLNLNPKRVTKTYSRKEPVVDIDVPADLELIVNESESSALDNEPPKTEPPPQSPEVRRSKRGAAPEVTLVSKRARVIKKKVIWDPAEVPKTQVLNAIRRAQALELKAKRQQQREETTTTDTEDDKPKKQNKKEDVRELRKNRLLKVQKKILMKRQLRSLKSRFRSSNGELKSSIALSKKKKQVMAEIAKRVNKNRKTEIDKLLGDEGAVNMLYSVKTKSRGPGRPKLNIPQKDLLNRARAVKETLASQTEEGKALRNSTPVRKKSRDSVRSSLQSPPPSPTVSYRGVGAEASRIIRRHSSSFSSDSSTPRRLSVDQTDETPQRNLRRKPNTPEKKTEKLTPVEKKKLNIEMTKNFDKKRKVKKENEFVVENEYKEITVKQCNGFYQICLNYPTNAKLKDSISLQMFNELNTVLNKLSVDNNCKIVALTSKGKSFCNGLDFSYLIQTTAEKRSQAASEMSKTLKEFILTISKFPKILIASLHSSASYLGCTMLPYFDYVLCSETATISADYPRLGQSPEGAPLVSLSPKIGQTLTSELLLMGKKFNAKEALDAGLVNQVEKADKLEEALGKIAEDIGSKSQQSLTSTKSLLRQPMLAKLGEALELEQKVLLEHWASPECQQTFKKLLQEQEVW